VKYTSTEMELISEARQSKGLLSAMWVTGKGPRGGKVSAGKGRYDTINMMVIEGKAEVLLRFRSENHSGVTTKGHLDVYGLMIKVKRIKKDKVSKHE
jgi:hypothetical protein